MSLSVFYRFPFRLVIDRCAMIPFHHIKQLLNKNCQHPLVVVKRMDPVHGLHVAVHHKEEGIIKQRVREGVYESLVM